MMTKRNDELCNMTVLALIRLPDEGGSGQDPTLITVAAAEENWQVAQLTPFIIPGMAGLNKLNKTLPKGREEPPELITLDPEFDSI